MAKSELTDAANKAKFADVDFGAPHGIGGWLSSHLRRPVADRLRRIEEEPLTKVQLNQLLVRSEEASVSDGFYSYYWAELPHLHPYNVVASVGEFDESWSMDEKKIVSLDHLHWGLKRIFIDGLLFFGNVAACFQSLRSMQHEQISGFFENKRFDTESIRSRGPAMPLREIAKDDRYLISEMACKSLGRVPEAQSNLEAFLLQSWRDHVGRGGKRIPVRDLLSEERCKAHDANQMELEFTADEILDVQVSTEDELRAKIKAVAKRYARARDAALDNTESYLSVVNDLDVYVATSMRSRQDFRNMANVCDEIFAHPDVTDLHVRYFDPTLSAADGHEDKGLIECLMVKCAKVLVYCTGEKESYGKDAEAAMALSLGKPVIFYCDTAQKQAFFRDVHPLSRLIDFSSGVAVGAIAADSAEDVSVLIGRILGNRMQYSLEPHSDRPNFLRLKEAKTGSIVRLQTDNDLLSRTFWNNYHNRDSVFFKSLAAGKELERRLE